MRDYMHHLFNNRIRKMSKYLNNIFVNHIPEGLRVDIDTGENQAISKGVFCDEQGYRRRNDKAV